jgi:integrase
VQVPSPLVHEQFQTVSIPNRPPLILAVEPSIFTVKGFGNYMSDAIKAAGLPGRCKAHGLRKAAARRLAEADCSTKQIASVTGHRTLSEIERYTRGAEQQKLARQAMSKVARTNRRR